MWKLKLSIIVRWYVFMAWVNLSIPGDTWARPYTRSSDKCGMTMFIVLFMLAHGYLCNYMYHTNPMYTYINVYMHIIIYMYINVIIIKIIPFIVTIYSYYIYISSGLIFQVSRGVTGTNTVLLLFHHSDTTIFGYEQGCSASRSGRDGQHLAVRRVNFGLKPAFK